MFHRNIARLLPWLSGKIDDTCSKIFPGQLMHTRPCPGTSARKGSPTQLGSFVYFLRYLIQVPTWRQKCFWRENSGFGLSIVQFTFPQNREPGAGFSPCLIECLSVLLPACWMYKIYVSFINQQQKNFGLATTSLFSKAKQRTGSGWKILSEKLIFLFPILRVTHCITLLFLVAETE